MTEERTVDVPVHLVGEAAGAKEGGMKTIIRLTSYSNSRKYP